MFTLPTTENLSITEEKISDRVSKFVIEPLSPGYGMTLGHSLRRVLLTSLEGAAASYIKIEGVDHEFSTLKGMREDVVELIINIKSMRVRSESAEPVTIKLKKKGGEVKVSDFEPNSDIEFADPDHHLATLEKDGKLNMEVVIEKGRGYVTVASKNSDEKLPIGTLAIDSIFTPIKKVHYDVEHTRVGGQTDFDKLTLELTTDGTVAPAEAVKYASQILVEHFQFVLDGATKAAGEAAPKETKAKKTKKSTAKKSK
ncbi:DNA-directed RNA polymerase subunit alpha [Candidatus Berkelbacteria bacterium]|nr:DNA-directed RNA polymerase subunit alpha [Candidatus Berkelbacteria bacterium]